MEKENQVNTEIVEVNQRLEHLNRTLKAIRNINKIIVSEDDPRRLIERACLNLTETMAYHNAWIALLGGEAARGLGLESDGPVAATAAAGLDGGFETVRERLERGEFPECMAQGLGREDVFMVNDPAVDCPRCPLIGRYGERAVWVRRLEHNGVIWGTLTTSVPANYADDAEEQDLFNEMAGDIAFALHRITAARKQENRRRHMALVIEGSGVGTWEWNVQTNKSRINEQWAAMLGYTIEELTPYDYTRWERLVHPEDIERARRALADCVAGRTTNYSCEIRMQHKDGRWVWILDRGRIMTRDAAGQALSMYGTHTDITEQKRLQNQSLEAQSFLETVLNQSPVPLWIGDAEGTLIRTNKALRDAVGVTDEQLVGTYHPLNDPNVERAGLTETIRKVIEEFEPARFSLLWRPEAYWGDEHGEARERYMDQVMYPIVRDGKLRNIVTQWQDITERVRTETALRESEQRLQAVFNAVDGVPIQGYDKDRRVIFWNPASERLYGYTYDEAIGRTLEELIIPEAMREAVVEGIQQWYDQDIPIPASEIELLHKSGKHLQVYSNHVMITNHRGEKEMFCIDVDMTKIRQVEHRMAWLSAVVDNSDNIVVVKDLDLRVVATNPAFAKAAGHTTVDTLIGKTDAEIFGFKPDTEPIRSYMADDRHAQTLPPGEYIRREEPVVSPDGEVRTFLTKKYPIYDQSGILLGTGNISTDITKRKQAEEELLRKQRSLDLYNRIANVFLTTNGDDVFNGVLDVVLKLLDSRFGLFGYIDEAGDLVCPSLTRDIWDQCEVDDKSIVFPRSVWGGLWGRSLVEKRTLIADEGLQLPQGHVALDNALATPIVHHDTLIGEFVVANKVGGYDQEDVRLLEAAAMHTAPILFAMREEARQKIAHEKLEAQLRQAHKMEAVGRLAGGVAHDFNNMLSIILLYADMILAKVKPDQPFYDELTKIREAGTRSADLTRQLLAFARQQTVAPEMIDLNKTVEEMLKMLQRLIGEDIDIVWIPHENVWPVKIDPGQIDQILANLCLNARDAITDVGKVTIETGNTVFDEAYCREHADFTPGEYAMLVVSDNGAGMDAETLSHLFEPFFTTKKLGKGTGLGLATVYGVVKQNNGLIHVYSEPGQGTTFKIYLPRHKVKTAVTSEPEPDRRIERGHETILLVEDESTILEVIFSMLQKEGYTVMGASTPGEAIRLATEHAGDIQLLITDVVMPEMNGRDLAKNILSLYPEVKCLFMSGYTANVIAHHGVLDEGANFIQKPFSLEDMTSKVREALDQN